MKTNVEKLETGDVTVIDCGKVRIHVYNTADAINDQVIMLERPHVIGKNKAVILELPPFKDGIQAFTKYIQDKKIDVEARLVSYHAAGTFLPDVHAYMTENAQKYNTQGGGKALIDNFAGIFGEAFDPTVVGEGEIIKGGKLDLAGIEMVINPDNDAYEVEVPEAKAVYVHMLGHDCHSIVAGAGHADAIIANLRGYLDKGYEIFLSSHYSPETRQDVETKIAYLERLKAIASDCKDAESFKAAVNQEFAGYSGGNYLDMTAGFFFPQ